MQKVHEELERILPKAIALAEDIFKNPELGYKEFRSREKVEEALQDAEIPFTEVAYTGLMATLDSGKEGPCIGLVAEFDAVPVLGRSFSIKLLPYYSMFLLLFMVFTYRRMLQVTKKARQLRRGNDNSETVQ